MNGYYTFHMSAESQNEEMRETLLFAKTGPVGGLSRISTRSTTLTFDRKRDRDNWLIWCLRAADHYKLPLIGIIK